MMRMMLGRRCLSLASRQSPLNRPSNIRLQIPSLQRHYASKKTETKNIFLDNLGTIFLSSIALLIATLVRSSYGTSNRNRVRDSIEEQAAIDPLELQDLQLANTELSPAVLRRVVQTLPQQCSYNQLVPLVRQRLTEHVQEHPGIRMVGTIELGHLLDRVVLSVLKDQGISAQDELPRMFWGTLLSLAMNASVPDRIQFLYSLLPPEATSAEVQELVGYLQDTCQLTPDTQVVPTEQKYPTQQYAVGKPTQLVQHAFDANTVSVDDLAAVLRSKTVCAWGECYHKKKFG